MFRCSPNPQFARGGIPELHRLIVRARDQGLSIRTPRNAVDIPSVSLQAGSQFAHGAIPELDRLVISTRGQELSVRTPGPRTRRGFIGLLLFLKREPQGPNREKQQHAYAG
jgi:hypothetical protein